MSHSLAIKILSHHKDVLQRGANMYPHKIDHFTSQIRQIEDSIDELTKKPIEIKAG